MNSISKALKFGAQLLQESSDNDNYLEARLLLAYALGKDTSWLYTWPEYELSKQQEQLYSELLEYRTSGMPIAYITHEREFWSLSFKVTEDTLIPRPETELLVSTVLQLMNYDHPISLLDLGTGSGAIAIALASESPCWSITATDASMRALSVAKSNASRLGTPQISFIHGDWFIPLENGSKFHIITSNPPYVAENDPHLQQGDLKYEPAYALSSGATGLDDLQRIIVQAPAWLHNNGRLLVEHGFEQGESVRNLFKKAGFCEISTQSDLEHRERMTMGCWR